MSIMFLIDIMPVYFSVWPGEEAIERNNHTKDYFSHFQIQNVLADNVSQAGCETVQALGPALFHPCQPFGRFGRRLDDNYM